MTYRQAAISFLKERGPMHYRDLADAIMTAGAVQARGATPAATLNATIAVDIKRKGQGSVFVRIRPGVFGLRRLHEPAAEVLAVPANPDEEAVASASEDASLRVRVPYYPLYSVRRDKAPFLSGCESRPATVAPAGSSRSGRWR